MARLASNIAWLVTSTARLAC